MSAKCRREYFPSTGTGVHLTRCGPSCDELAVEQPGSLTGLRLLAPHLTEKNVAAVLAEASLSFLGLGIRPPYPSWGSMLSDARDQITTAPWLSVFPGLAIFLTVLGLNLLGDGLRDIIDPQSRSRRA